MAKEILLEEAVLDDLAEGLGIVEVPLSEKVFRLAGILIIAVIVLVIFRFLFIGLFKSSFYKERALVNASEIILTPAERGIIFDRFEKQLTKNQPSFRLNLELKELLKEQDAFKKKIALIGQTISLPEGAIEDLIKVIDPEKQDYFTLPVDLSTEEVLKIKNLNLAGVKIESSFKREYPYGRILVHLLGYTGPVDKKDLELNPSLSISQKIGKAGLENFYEKELTGKEGKIIKYRDVKGNILEEKTAGEPEAGDMLYTTLDLDLQSYFYSRLKQQLVSIGSSAGVGIALNPQNGEILSLISFPDFDNNSIEVSDLQNPHQPFFNRAVSGLYSPGSTIKPLVAFAALAEGVVRPETEIFSAGYLDVPNPYDPENPSRFLDWRAHGWVDLYSALAASSNVYFYSAGGGLDKSSLSLIKGSYKASGIGIEKLKAYWQKFGLGEKTGIDLPGESDGFLPDPVYKKQKRGSDWRLGDTYNVSIGQGDLLVTPIELINYIAAISNGGKFYKPFIVQKIVDTDGKTVKENSPQVLGDLSDQKEIIADIQKGMADAVKKPYGTAYKLSDLPFKTAAKTGTAQIFNNTKLNALFVGYGPADGEARPDGRPAGGPQIAILVLVENASEGSLNAVPVAKDVLNWYYLNRIQK